MSATTLLDIVAQDDTPPTTGSGSRLGSAVVIVSGTTSHFTNTGVFAFIATCISLFSIWLQLKNYRKPILQRYVVRILLMYVFSM
jgi:Organic solute transporter Ostalpha